MPKPENANKPNKGQDENLHTFINDAGETRQGTMREFRETLRDQGFRKPEDDATDPVPEPAVEDPI